MFASTCLLSMSAAVFCSTCPPPSCSALTTWSPSWAVPEMLCADCRDKVWELGQRRWAIHHQCYPCWKLVISNKKGARPSALQSIGTAQHWMLMALCRSHCPQCLFWNVRNLLPQDSICSKTYKHRVYLRSCSCRGCAGRRAHLLLKVYSCTHCWWYTATTGLLSLAIPLSSVPYRYVSPHHQCSMRSRDLSHNDWALMDTLVFHYIPLALSLSLDSSNLLSAEHQLSQRYILLQLPKTALLTRRQNSNIFSFFRGRGLGIASLQTLWSVVQELKNVTNFSTILMKNYFFSSSKRNSHF